MGFRRNADAYRDDYFWLDPVMGHPKAGEKIPKLPAMAGDTDHKHHVVSFRITCLFDII